MRELDSEAKGEDLGRFDVEKTQFEAAAAARD
jgi:hypothetical protein